MAESRPKRHLAAILAADVVGYSRLMEMDEAGTLAALTLRRKTILAPTLQAHAGRLVKVMGDGVLVEFGSAVAAVQCAVDLQKSFTDENSALPPDRRIVLRIGINMGEVIAQDDDIFGEAVNVAARLEGLAPPGGICVSASIHDQAQRKLDLAFADLGPQTLKNIAEPVRVYRVVANTEGAATSGHGPAGERGAIAVLPFDNISGDPEQAYFSDGITEDIITELSKFRELKVIARNSSFQFRGASTDIRTVAQRLGVAFVVEGSVRKAGSRIRVTAQLIEAATATHVWAERYDRDLTDLFAIQDEISHAITSRVAGLSLSVLANRTRGRPTNSLSAYDWYLRGRELFINYDTGMASVPLLEKAIELDPHFAIPHALLSDMSCFQYGFDGRDVHLDRALELARRALELDPQEPWANYAMGWTLVRRGLMPEAGHYFDRARALNPNDAYIMAVHADWLVRMGRAIEALAVIDEALRRDPYAYDWFWDNRAVVLAALGRYGEAVESFSRMTSRTSIPPNISCIRAICFAETGRVGEARAALAECRRTSGGRASVEVLSVEPFGDAGTKARLIDGLRRAEAAAAR